MKIVVYLRLSKEDGDDESSSITNQRRILEEYARSKGWIIVEYYIDDGYSGYTLDRPDFNRLKRDLNDNKVDLILVKDLSRLGRHNAKVQLFLENIVESGKRLIAPGDNYDTENENSLELSGIQTWVNEKYVRDISKKVRRSIASLQKEGKWICRVPYGYIKDDKDKTKYYVDELSAHYVKKIFDMYISGMGIKFIARELTEQGIPTPSMIKKQHLEAKGMSFSFKVTNKWDVSSISRILRNEFYIGTLTLGKHKLKGINGKRQNVPEEERYVFKEAHEPIIDKATFYLVQDIIKDRSFGHYRGKKIQTRDNIFSGLLYCADCGKKLTSSGSTYTRYICNSYNVYGTKVCTSHALSENELKDTMLDFMEHCRDNLCDIINDIDQIVQAELQSRSNSDNNIAQLSKMLEDAKNATSILIEQKMRDTMKNPNMVEMIDKMYADMLNEKYKEIQSLEKQLFDQKDIALDEIELKKNLKTARGIITEIIATGEITKKQIMLLVDRIVVYEDSGVDIYLKGNLHEVSNNYFKLNENKINNIKKHVYNYIMENPDKFIAGDCAVYIRNQGDKVTNRTVTSILKELQDNKLIEKRPMNHGFKLTGSHKDLERSLLNNNVVGVSRWLHKNNDIFRVALKVSGWVKDTYFNKDNETKNLF